jgi:hypothetical protein
MNLVNLMNNMLDSFLLTLQATKFRPHAIVLIN